MGRLWWGANPDYVISVVKQYPSLVDKFAIEGYQKIQQLEDSLISEDGLKRSDRVRVQSLVQKVQLNA